MRRYILLFAAMLFTLTCTVAFAHAGKTDSKGGHYDYSTGEYHYHHGYPAHKHTNGKCPYDFDDKTGESSGSSSSGSYYSQTYTSAPRTTRSPVSTNQSTVQRASRPSLGIFGQPWFYILSFGGVFVLVCVIQSRIKEKERLQAEERKRQEYEKQKREKTEFYRTHDLRVLCKIPDNIRISSDLVPYSINVPEGYKYGADLDVYLGRNCYHRKTCRHAIGLPPRNAYFVYDYYPCSQCKPAALPDQSWLNDLKQHVWTCEKFGITPRISPPPGD